MCTLKYGENLPTDLSTMHLYPVDGAAHKVGADDTAWAYRDADWSVSSPVSTRIRPTRRRSSSGPSTTGTTQPYSMGGAYVNFLGAGEGQDRVGPPTATTPARRGQADLRSDNLFHTNQNIQPAG